MVELSASKSIIFQVKKPWEREEILKAAEKHGDEMDMNIQNLRGATLSGIQRVERETREALLSGGPQTRRRLSAATSMRDDSAKVN